MSSSESAPARAPNIDRWMLLIVIAVSVTIAAVSLLNYYELARFRWGRMENDRNAHYLLGLNLALDVRHLDIRALLADLDGARVWPPLHGILVAVVLLLGGIDYRLAVLPSLAGWVGTVVLGFLIARRAVPAGGNLAGLVAAVFILASPAHRVFATDIMLESLGSCLSLWVLYLYLIAEQEPSARAYRKLALALTALFLLKYNYWFLVAAGILAARILQEPKQTWASLRQALATSDWRTRVRTELRSPLVIIALTSLFLMTIVVLSGGWKFELFGKTVSIRSHQNFFQVAYIALFVRCAIWWKKNGRVWKQSVDFRVRELALWHLLPVAIWLLLPKRVGSFLFFLSPANGRNSPLNLFWGLDFYWNSLRQDYHTGMLSALLALGLLPVALARSKRLNPGARGIILFVLLAALLTVAHPNRKSRFLHSWVPAGWVLSGVAVSLLVGSIPGRRRRGLIALGALATLGIWQLSDPFTPGHSPETGHHTLQESPLDLSDFYLPFLSRSHHTTFLATVPVKHFAQWTFLEKYQDRNRLTVFLNGFGWSAQENKRLFEKWLGATPSDTVVLLDVPPSSPSYFSGEDFHQQYREMLLSQSVFKISKQQFFSHYGCTVSLWTRKN